MSRVLQSEHAVNRLSYLLRLTRGNPDSLEAYKYATEYLTSMVRSLAATDQIIHRKVQQRIATVEEYLKRQEKI